MRTYLKDSNTKKIFIYMVDSTDHATPETGETVSVKVSKNGGAFGAGGGSVAELEEGVYAYTPSAGDVDTLGPIAFKATASGCDPFIVEGLIVSYDPYDSVRMGQTALPNAAPGENGGLPTTNGTKVNQTVDTTATANQAIRAEIDAQSSQLATLTGRLSAARAGYMDKLNVSGTLAHTDNANSFKATGFSTHSAADVKTAMEAAGSILALMWADLINGGRLDLLIDAIKAQCDKMTFNESNEIAASASVAGAGAITHTYTVQDGSGNAIPDVRVSVYSNAACTVMVARGTTNNFGQVVFYLDAGTYYMVCQKAGYIFTNPDTEVVA